MARVIITIPGRWSNESVGSIATKLKTPFTLEVVPAERGDLEDIVTLGRQCEVLTDDQVGFLRKAPELLEATLVFDRPGDRTAAKAAARLMVDALALGGMAAFVETSMRVIGPETLASAELDDVNTLFHLFVGVFVDDAEHVAATEGLQCFDLPDVVAHFTPGDEESVSAAQAAAFSLSAQMVCDRLRPTSGGVFRASESAPWYRLVLQPVLSSNTEEGVDDAFVNPRGTFVLTPRIVGKPDVE